MTRHRAAVVRHAQQPTGAPRAGLALLAGLAIAGALVYVALSGRRGTPVTTSTGRPFASDCHFDRNAHPVPAMALHRLKPIREMLDHANATLSAPAGSGLESTTAALRGPTELRLTVTEWTDPSLAPGRLVGRLTLHDRDTGNVRCMAPVDVNVGAAAGGHFPDSLAPRLLVHAALENVQFMRPVD